MTTANGWKFIEVAIYRLGVHQYSGSHTAATDAHVIHQIDAAGLLCFPSQYLPTDQIMIRMKSVIALASCLIVSSAFAQADSTMPSTKRRAPTQAAADEYASDRDSALSMLTRAQVLADLEAYQASGLAEAERLQLEQGRETSDLRTARDRYAAMTQREREVPVPLTRAEVLADLKVYQESGLAEVERVASEQGHDTAVLIAARERYAALRHGERYASLVMKMAECSAQAAGRSKAI